MGIGSRATARSTGGPRNPVARRALTTTLTLALGLALSACAGDQVAGTEDGPDGTIASADTTAPDPTGPTAADGAGEATPDAVDGDEAEGDELDGDDGANGDGDRGGADRPDESTTTTARQTTTTTEPEPENLLEPVGPDDDGDDVVALQTRLDELGFSTGPADGDYGRRTENAVRVFQELVDLRPTGRADTRTMRELATYTYDGLLLVAGDEGDDVEELQERLAGGPFDPGQIDGVYGGATIAAVWALEKLAEIPIDGDWGPADELAWRKLMDGEVGGPERANAERWVEVDLSQQLMKVYDPGETVPVLVSHVSSGSGIPWENEDHRGNSVTPKGDFHISRRISGWRESSLNIGRLYNPLYFNGGIAFHGATSVPLYPASHGCVRVPMHIAEYLPDELPNGTAVHVMA
ncbi:MAG: L,D-transpeptidase family protein [Actinomycetota bacterium]